MRKEFDKSELLLEKKEKQIYCFCLTQKQSKDSWAILKDQVHLSIIQSDFS